MKFLYTEELAKEAVSNLKTLLTEKGCEVIPAPAEDKLNGLCLGIDVIVRKGIDKEDLKLKIGMIADRIRELNRPVYLKKIGIKSSFISSYSYEDGGIAVRICAASDIVKDETIYRIDFIVGWMA